jgi:alpha-tubulin suppressor-like RCC1 family protein
MEITTPKLIEKLQDENVVSVACGWLHSLALTDSGKVYQIFSLYLPWKVFGWGNSHYDQVTLMKIFLRIVLSLVITWSSKCLPFC